MIFKVTARIWFMWCLFMFHKHFTTDKQKDTQADSNRPTDRRQIDIRKF